MYARAQISISETETVQIFSAATKRVTRTFTILLTKTTEETTKICGYIARTANAQLFYRSAMTLQTVNADITCDLLEKTKHTLVNAEKVAKWCFWNATSVMS
jgi:hypothetical protein